MTKDMQIDAIIDLTEQNAQQVIVEESSQRAVLIDFWADWCAPCKTLMPILEKLAAEYDGQFLLAKVNADEQQALCANFGVRSLPTVMLVKDGQPVDGFAGAKSEQEVRELLEKYLPKPWDIQLEQAKALISAQKHADALPVLAQAYTESSQQADIALVYTDALIHLKRLDEATAILEKIKLADRDATFEQLLAQLELAREARKAPEVEALEAQLKKDPENAEVLLQLAVQYSQHAFHREALELIFPVIQKKLDFMEGEGRKIFLDILAVLGKADPLAVEYQRKYYTLLY